MLPFRAFHIFAVTMKNNRIIIASFALLLAGAAVHAQDKDVKTLTKTSDGTVIINTMTIGRDIDGFAGTVPVEIHIKDGKVSNIETLENEETPSFFAKAETLLSKWTGKTVKDALETEVDAVSGATYSSEALIANVRRGLEYYQNPKGKEK